MSRLASIGAPSRRMFGTTADEHGPLMKRWTARLLLGMPQFLDGSRSFVLPELAAYLGLKTPKKGEPTLEALQSQARSVLRGKAPRAGDRLSRNLERIGEALALEVTELEILRFRILLYAPTPLRNLCVNHGPERADRHLQILAVALDRPCSEIEAALRPGQRLSRSGLLTYGKYGDLEDRLCIMECLYNLLVVEADDVLELFRAILVPAPGATLGFEHYPHLAAQVGMIASYLAAAVAAERVGVNILLYGPPGTGKTELARTLTKRVGLNLMEVALEDDDGDPLDSAERWKAYRLAQNLIRPGGNTLLLVDEVESLLAEESSRGPGRGSEMEGWKAWINRALETNPVPTLWITNRPWNLDSAFRRRFDLTLEMDTPPRGVRRAHIEARTGRLSLSDRFKDRLADEAGLTPANLDRAVKVLSELDGLDSERAAEGAFATLVDEQLKLSGGAFEWRADEDLGLPHRLDWLNTDPPLATVVEGLRASGTGRLCLHGLPGTGKSAFARELAKALDRPLLLKRASDILDPFLGITERNIARAFREAAQDRAILVIDEVDSFLQDRRSATQRWESTQVNELLTQMEAFDGILVATTNMPGNLDPASLRRFDLKVKFSALLPEQCESLVEAMALQLDLYLDAAHRARVRALRVFTPGDAAAVLRQARFNPPTDAADLIARLEAETRHDKGGEKGKVGF